MAVLSIQHIILMSVTPTTFWGGQSSVITEPLLLVVPNLKLVSRALCWPQPCKHLSHSLLFSPTCTRNIAKQLRGLTCVKFKYNFLFFFKKNISKIHFKKIANNICCGPLMINVMKLKFEFKLILLQSTKFNVMFRFMSLPTLLTLMLSQLNVQFMYVSMID